MKGPAVRLTGDRLLLQPLLEEEKEKIEDLEKVGKLYVLPGSSASKKNTTQSDRLKWATVMRIGTKVEDINEGDVILFDKMSAADLPIDGELYTIIRGSDLIAVRV